VRSARRLVKGGLPGRAISTTGTIHDNVVGEVTMLRSVEFQHRGRRYHGTVAPVPGGGPEFSDGAWFVSIDGGPVRRVFEAHPEDADTSEFRHRVVIATWLTEGYNRRVSGERRQQGGRDPSVRDRRIGPEGAHTLAE
jgi:hypothetical protein